MPYSPCKSDKLRLTRLSLAAVRKLDAFLLPFELVEVMIEELEVNRKSYVIYKHQRLNGYAGHAFDPGILHKMAV